MADKKISELTALAGASAETTDLVPVADLSATETKKMTLAELLIAIGGQPLDSDLTAIAALSTTSFGRSLLAAADASALRTLAGTVIGTDVQAYDGIGDTFHSTGLEVQAAADAIEG